MSMVMVVLVKVLLTGFLLTGLWFGLFHWWVVPSVVSVKQTMAPQLKQTVCLPIPEDPSALVTLKVLARREAACLRYTLSGEDEYAEIRASLRAKR